jgi:hypothetical protein
VRVRIRAGLKTDRPVPVTPLAACARLPARGRGVCFQQVQYDLVHEKDMDLIREILLYAEESPAGVPWSARPLLDHDPDL